MDYTKLSTEELLKLLDEWRGAGAYSITGDIIRELRKRNCVRHCRFAKDEMNTCDSNMNDRLERKQLQDTGG